MWNRVDGRLGVEGQPAPTMRFGRVGGGAYAATDQVGDQRQIVLSHQLRKEAKNPYWRRMAQRTMAHEMRHTQQSPELFATANDSTLPWSQRAGEQDANTFAREVMKGIPKRNERKRVKRSSTPR